jgi:hypothetical protein
MAQQAEVQEEFEVVEEIPDQSYHSFLHSREWAEIRRRVIERAGHVCEACGRAEAVICPPFDDAVWVQAAALVSQGGLSIVSCEISRTLSIRGSPSAPR